MPGGLLPRGSSRSGGVGRPYLRRLASILLAPPLRLCPFSVHALPIAATTALVATLVSVAACSDQEGALVVSRAALEPGVTYVADLDGDEHLETILIDTVDASLTISDEHTVYRSRAKWRLVDASLGDTDHNGLPEVVALVDAQDGRHLALFAFFGGEYRERLVTSKIDPPPLALQVADGVEVAGAQGLEPTPGSSADIVVLLHQLSPGGTDPGQILLRWNGFGFTRIGPDELR